MTPQELKNSILQLAIQGKLVEQRPEEGVAEVPAAHKHGGKEARRHGEIEPPFDIPESWRWVRLGEVGSWGSGATPSRTKLEYYGGTIPWLKTGDLNDGYISDVPEKITELALAQTSVRMNPAGSVLMAMYGATIGKLGIITVPMTTNQACCACAPYEGIYNRYLFFFLLARRQAFIKMGEGGAQPNISKEKIVNSLIPLPPLSEQKRIVSRIEELLPLLARYEQAWTKLEAFNTRFPSDLQKSLLHLAIQGKLVPQLPEEGVAQVPAAPNTEKKKARRHGEEIEPPFDIPESWRWVRLGEVASKVTDGTHKTPRYTNTGIRFVSAKDICGDRLRFDKCKYISKQEHDELFARCNPGKGDLLISKSGSIGAVALVEVDFEFSLFESLALVKYDQETIFPQYLRRAVQAACLTLNPEKVRGVAVKHLPIADIKSITIPLPPLAEQKRIVAKLEELLPLCERLKGTSA